MSGVVLSGVSNIRSTSATVNMPGRLLSIRGRSISATGLPVRTLWNLEDKKFKKRPQSGKSSGVASAVDVFDKTVF